MNQLICAFLFVLDGDAHPGLPIGVFKRVCMFFADVLHSCILVAIVGLKHAHESVV